MSDRVAEAAQYAEDLANHLFHEVGGWGGSAVTYRCVANLMFLLNVEPDLSESTKSALWDLAESFPPGTFPVGGSDD